MDPALRDWLTLQFDRLVLVVARSITALNRLLDVVSLLRTDRRVQVVFTTDPAGRAVFQRGVEEVLAGLGAAVVGWEDATSVEFDMVLAASENDRLDLLRGPILLVSHGFGRQKYYPRGRVVAGMNPKRLVRDGRVVPAVIGISHPDQRTQLQALCPPAATRAEVIGDPALDRMLASRHRVPSYRAALGATGRSTVLLASTWGPESLLGRWPDLPETLAAALPVDQYRVLAALHPGVWAAHSRWQILGWLTRAREAGVRVVDSQHWQAALLASDLVVSDHGSLTLYAAALDKPLLMTNGDAESTVVGSPLAELAAATSRLDGHQDLRDQIDAALARPPSPDRERVITRTVSRPGISAHALRRVAYRLLNLRDPDLAADYPAAARPEAADTSWTTLVCSATERDGVLRIRRTPAIRHGFANDGLDYRHLIGDLDTASIRELDAAGIIALNADTAFAESVGRLLTEWPDARLVAARDGAGGCAIGHAGGVLAAAVRPVPAGFDPLVLASAVHVRMRQGHPPEGVFPIEVGGQVVTVRVVAAS